MKRIQINNTLIMMTDDTAATHNRSIIISMKSSTLTVAHMLQKIKIRKLIVNYYDEAVSDHNQLISQVIESINKMKNSFIADKMIAARQLFSENVLIIINMIIIKKKLEHNSV